MLAPSKALHRAADTGKALPRVDVLADLYSRGVDFRASQLWMMTGRPKAGKTFLAQWLVSEIAKAARSRGEERPGLYFFMDGTPYTAAVRQAAYATGHKTSEIAEALGGPGAAYYEEVLSEQTDIEFVFDKKPDLPSVQQEIDAYVEKWDRYPAWMIFDNLLNFEGSEEDHRAQKFILGELQGLAYRTGANIGVLHHATESGVKDYSKPPRANDTDGKVTQIPEMVLSVAKDPVSDRFSIAVAAVRDGGASDPNAENPVVVYADFSTVSFTRYRQQPAWSPSDYTEEYE